MPDLLRSLWLAIRRWPIYAGLAGLGLLAFVGAGLRGYRLLGDDNESTETARNSPGTHGGGHAGHGAFYHK
ncbi:hypothetical protein E4631_03715 [Hymenobacter sp. UV11]|uniref:hypothetical protein n=1 Tax=Hymenobacter sp. UV11 TaxID=1849735 RepID=UPI00105DE16E|nr:hypothetical protein [Hymenobacter sp. UV11]TDN36067.1 hypothetical protein A8B98_11770 [Hymenobacter sp. UV11]TFZ68107.1 hypothetical protein E4631_03715 [Hymenobacter sp. UV11]